MFKSKLKLTGKIIFFFFVIILMPIFAFSENIKSKNDQYSNFLNTNFNSQIFFSKHNSGDGNVLGALKINLKPGWKIYWRNPGEAGLPPELDWSDVENVKKVEFLFPAPKRFNFFGIETFGYTNEVIFPIKISKLNKKSPVKGVLKFDAQICKEVCVPIERKFEIHSNIHIGNLNQIKKIKQFLLKVPYENVIEKKFFSKVSIIEGNLKLFLKEEINNINFDLIVEDNKFNIFSKFSIHKTEDKKKYVLIKNINKFEKNIHESNFTITFLSEKYNFYQNLKISEQFKVNKNYISILIVSFVAGLILNIMPCVLPVLSLKIASFLSLPNVNSLLIKKKVFLQITGIICSFLILFLITSILKFTGSQMSWGFQFQNTTFLIIIIFVIFTFGFNLLGFFEMTIPWKILTSLQKIKINNYEDFFSGMLMTLLSTPCTAPFVGTAAMYALSGSYYESFFVFLFMSLGLSFPLILVFIYPNSLKLLPKTGKWMLNFKKFMGILFVFSGLWFLSILINNFFETNNKIVTEGSINWKSWDIKNDPKLIEKLVSQDKIIFLDITADWCITCKYNRIFVLNDKKIKKLINDKNIITLQLDWTKKNRAIEKFLFSKNRYGIPYNEIYSKKYFDGVLFPELLNKKIIYKLINESK